MDKKNDRFSKPDRPSQRESDLPTDAETSDGALQRARYKLLMAPRGSKFSVARARAMADLAQVYWQRLQFDEAIAIWHQLLELARIRGDKHQLGMILAALATTCAQKGDFAPAIEHAQAALLHDPQNPVVLLMLGNAYEGAGEDDKAFQAWRRLIEAHPDCEGAYCAIGSLHARRGEFAEAEALFLKSLAMKPQSDATLNALANMYISMERFEDALARLREAHRRWPGSPTAHNNIGDCFMTMGRYAEAIGAYEKRIEMRPKDALSANLCLGVILRLRDDDDSRQRGAQHLREALNIYKSGRARLYTRRIDHDARGALALTALDENTALGIWQSLLANPEIAHVGVGAVREWRLLLGLLQQWPHPPKCLGEVAALLTQKYGKPQCSSPPPENGPIA